MRAMLKPACVGSDATDVAGVFSIVKTKAAAASPNARPKIFKLRMFLAPKELTKNVEGARRGGVPLKRPVDLMEKMSMRLRRSQQ